MKSSFATSWKRSVQTRKQRKYRHNAPLHIKQKMVRVHLSPELRTKYGVRNTQVKTGDKVKVMRGKFRKKEGKVEKVNLKREKVIITGLELIKKDGTKSAATFDPSNLMITSLDSSDQRRKITKKKEVKKEEVKKDEKKVEKKPEVKKVEEKKIEKKTEAPKAEKKVEAKVEKKVEAPKVGKEVKKQEDKAQ
jgi:large subunit ribosomal protein L24